MDFLRTFRAFVEPGERDLRMRVSNAPNRGTENSSLNRSGVTKIHEDDIAEVRDGSTDTSAASAISKLVLRLNCGLVHE